MFCRNCGVENSDLSAKCSGCGAVLENPFQASMDSNNPYKSPGSGPVHTGGNMGTKPNNWLVPSILVTLCCCVPFGIVGIVFAAQVDGKWNSGDYNGAIKASDQARLWTLIGFGLGLTGGLLYFLLVIVAAAAG